MTTKGYEFKGVDNFIPAIRALMRDMKKAVAKARH